MYSKKLLSLFLALALVFSALPVTVLATNDASGFTYTVSDDEDTATITGYNGTSYYSISIPDKIAGYTVTAIDDGAFRDRSTLKSLIIPNTVTYIGHSAFAGCTALAAVQLSKSLTYIGDGAFENCDALTSVEIPKSLQEAGLYYYCGVFGGCDNLKTVTFEAGTTAIVNNLFYHCPGIEKITVPDTVTGIGDCAFEGCTALNSISIPGSVTSIGDSVFRGCTALSSISIPDSVTSIGKSAFEGCSSLESAKLPNTLTYIVENLFSDCSSLTTIELPAGVTTIRSSAFNGCTSLESVTFENGKTNLTAIYDSAFEGCGALKDIPASDKLKTIDGSAFYACNALTDVTIPANVTSIGRSVFADCVSLEKVSISASTKELGSDAFSGCEALKEISIADYSITAINENTFKDCPSIQAVVLPKGLKTIDNQAFMNDTGLTAVTIPESVTSIGSNAFSYSENTTVYGKTGSYAETYATDGGFTFVANGIETQGIVLVSNETVVTLENGQSYRAVFEVYPDDANEVITLTADNNNVSINGLDISTKYAGDTQITATTESGCEYTFNVHIKDVKEIVVTGKPDKLQFLLGEDLDTTGLVVSVTFSDGSAKEVTDYTVSGFDSSCEGECTVKLSWVSACNITYTTGYQVEIIDNTPKPERLQIKALPTKLTYETRQALDLSGMVVNLVYTDGSEKEITDYTVSGYNALKTGSQVITVSYGGLSDTFTVTVAAPHTHTWNDGVITTAATCKTIGVKTFTCTTCSGTKTEEIALDADNHEGKAEVVKNAVGATCLQKGYTGDIYWSCCDALYQKGEETALADHTDADKDNICDVCQAQLEKPPVQTDAIFTVGSITTTKGSEITLPVTVEKNPGFMYLKLNVIYDEAMFEFIGAENGQVSTDSFSVVGNAISWDNAADVNANGQLVTLKFKVKDTVADGSYDVSVKVIQCLNYDEDVVAFNITTGTIKIVSFVYGDVTGDMVIDGKDLIRIRKYLANLDETTGISTVEITLGADCNGDSAVDGKDLIRLRKYLANLDEETGVSTVTLGK